MIKPLTSHTDDQLLLKGSELPLPGRVFFQDPDGHEHRDIRMELWRRDVRPYREPAQVPPNHVEIIPQLEIVLLNRDKMYAALSISEGNAA